MDEEPSGGSKFRNRWRAAGLLSLIVPVMKTLEGEKKEKSQMMDLTGKKYVKHRKIKTKVVCT